MNKFPITGWEEALPAHQGNQLDVWLFSYVLQCPYESQRLVCAHCAVVEVEVHLADTALANYFYLLETAWIHLFRVEVPQWNTH